MQDDLRLSIGKIVGAHGIRGTLKIYPHVESMAYFEPGKTLCIRCKGGEIHHEVKALRPHKQLLLVDVVDVGNRDMAQALIGCQVLIERSALPALEQDTYYWADLVGLAVYTPKGCIGKIEAVIPTGSNDVYVVQGPGGEILVPALASVVCSVDLQARIMRVQLPEGL
jgi:16S rRNA processing protein RimM